MFLAIYITHPTEKVAQDISNHLIEKKLVACANIFPIKSAYWWQGKTEQGDEFVSLVKTRPDLWKSVCAEVEQLHPYDTPCMMKWEVEANAKYEQWIFDSTKKNGHGGFEQTFTKPTEV